jgi:putative mRNA 3-end processing factor
VAGIVERDAVARGLVDDSEVRLLYTADFHTADQRIVPGTSARPEADVVVTESTYADVEHDDRGAIERRFVESVRTTLWEGGTVVVPAFAIGRTQEILQVLAAHDVDCYLDGMGQRVTDRLQRHPAFLRDPDAFGRGKSNARYVDRPGQRERIADRNSVIVTTSGMLSGGPAMTYVPAIRSRPVNKIALTGYQVEGTPGRELVETGRAAFDGAVVPVSAQVEQYDFSAHADRDGLRSFLAPYEDSKLLLVHGDDCADFADRLAADGYDTGAPAVGDVVEL